VEREYEDVAAVIDAIAERAGQPVTAYGHSYGGLCLFGAAPLTTNLGRLALYEGWPPPDPEPFEPSASSGSGWRRFWRTGRSTRRWSSSSVRWSA
jgi:pimeloyl-ACP methyl ester carboxylesterase